MILMKTNHVAFSCALLWCYVEACQRLFRNFKREYAAYYGIVFKR